MVKAVLLSNAGSIKPANRRFGMRHNFQFMLDAMIHKRLTCCNWRLVQVDIDTKEARVSLAQKEVGQNQLLNAIGEVEHT